MTHGCVPVLTPYVKELIYIIILSPVKIAGLWCLPNRLFSIIFIPQLQSWSWRPNLIPWRWRASVKYALNVKFVAASHLAAALCCVWCASQQNARNVVSPGIQIKPLLWPKHSLLCEMGHATLDPSQYKDRLSQVWDSHVKRWEDVLSLTWGSLYW